MRYSYEFKRKCVEMYYRGEYPDTSEGISTERFHNKVREWVRIEESCGPDALRHKKQNKECKQQRYHISVCIQPVADLVVALFRW